MPNQTAHDCPDCTNELVAIYGSEQVVLNCENCGSKFRGIEQDDGEIIVNARYT